MTPWECVSEVEVAEEEEEAAVVVEEEAGTTLVAHLGAETSLNPIIQIGVETTRMVVTDLGN